MPVYCKTIKELNSVENKTFYYNCILFIVTRLGHGLRKMVEQKTTLSGKFMYIKIITCKLYMIAKIIKNGVSQCILRLAKWMLVTHQFSNGSRSKQANSIHLSLIPPPHLYNFYIVYFCPQQLCKICVNVNPCNVFGYFQRLNRYELYLLFYNIYGRQLSLQLCWNISIFTNKTLNNLRSQ